MSKRQNELDREIMELFNEKSVWKSHPKIKEGLEKKDKEKWGGTSQASISRALNRLGAEKTSEGWNLNHAKVFHQNLTELAELASDMLEPQPLFELHVSTAVLRTKQNYNRIIAKKIQETFKGEVVSTFCPNEKDIIIYYVQSGEGAFLREMCNMLGYELEQEDI